ncbi:MAG: hypothetical protein QM779_02030 [Propionicimonas sp.]|uniref:hypothetical protein n=1 Tax=Propionicimonas sp. TaxID=1955623 RepID=UPI003D14A33C
MAARRRAMAALGAAVAGVLLSGCHVQGTVDVLSTEGASLDLLVSDFTFECVPSSEPLASVRLEPGPDVLGSATCHVSGRMPLSSLGFSDFHASAVGEYWTFDGALNSNRGGWPDDEIEVRFPGDVLESNQGTIRGRSLLLNPARLTSGQIRVVTLNRPGPANWVVAAAAGGVAGIVLTILLASLIRWLNPPRPVLPAPVDAEADAPDPQAPTRDSERPPVDPTGTAPERPVIDHAWFATPGGEPSLAGPAPPVDATASVDHSIWASPEDR